MAGEITTRSAATSTGRPVSVSTPQTMTLSSLAKDLADLAPHKEHPVFFHGPLDELFVALACRADVDIEDVGLPVVDLVLVEHGLLGAVHAADLGAVGHGQFRIAGAGTLDPDDFLRFFAIGRTPHDAGGRTRGAEQALHGQGVDDVRHLPTAILAQSFPGDRARSRWPG